ncbi:MAG: isoprenylcysteine carboxylmethyltransferase family protein [Candidatus Methanofastidiosa archaeon]|nr:isoprenylcysteine carboxylmethyltransferase family protein [Candidatus Methanofastidiosa archaeon]
MVEKTKLTGVGIIALTSPFRWIVAMGAIYLIASGSIGILRAWAYIGVYTAGSLVSCVLLVKKVPGLLNQRGKIQEGTNKLDKCLILIYFLFAIVVTPLIAGLDYRFGISPLPFYFLYIGIGLYFVSLVFSIWPMLHNPFFEGTVRIQKNRDQKVIESGPYSIVGHPGYLGMLIGSLPLPFVFGSLLSFIPVSVMISLVFIRTYYEDRVLQGGLEGYTRYCQRIKYRLIPLVW